MSHVFSKSINNEVTKVHHLIDGAKLFMEPFQLDIRIVNAVSLVLEETLMNIIQYGYDDDDHVHKIDVQVTVDDDRVSIQLMDEGKAFNPLTVPRLDPATSTIEKLERGLGLHLVRNIMNSMAYSREKNYNIFEIWIHR